MVKSSTVSLLSLLVYGNGFHYLVSVLKAICCSGDGGVAYRSNHDPSGSRSLGAGVYGLSNSTLDSPWHKVKRGKEMFADIVKSPNSNLTDRLLKLLSDDTRFKHIDVTRIYFVFAVAGLILLFPALASLKNLVEMLQPFL